MLALLAMICGSVFAEDIIWSEDWSGYEASAVPSSENSAYSVTNGGGTTKIYNENLAGGTAPELLIGKSGGTFTATIELGGKTGEFTLSYMANYDRITVTSENATLGEKMNSGNNYTIPVSVSAGTSSIVLTFTNSTSSNVRFDEVKLYQGTAKANAGLSWGTASRTVTIGADDNIFPTLSNENNLTVIYSSSDESVATVDREGNIALVAAGKTNISASFDGDDSYDAQTVSYTLTVKAASAEDPETPETPDTPIPDTKESVTVAQALEIISGLEDGAKTADTYVVKGYIVGDPDFQRNASGTLYGNVNMTIADEEDGETTLTVFRAKSINNADFTETSMALLKEGDLVEVEGLLQKYVKDDVTTPELASGHIVSINGQTNPEIPETPAVTTENVTVARALAVINNLEDGATAANTYIVKGYIVGTPDFQRKNDGSLYGNVNMTIADEKDGETTLYVFRAKSIDNEAFTEETIRLLEEGDLVEIQGKLQKYVNGEETTPELIQGYLITVNGETNPAVHEGPVVTVPAPVFSIDGGAVEAGTTVELNVDGTAGTVYEIFYTTDGSEPTTSSSKYTEAIVINEDVTIKAIAVEPTGATSVVAQATFTVKAAKPEGVLFLETFDGTTGTGGNDGAFNGSIASNKLILDESWEEPVKCGGADQCLKFGASSDDGVFTTSPIALTGNGILTFRAAGWADQKTNTLTVSATGASVSYDTEIELTNGEWADYTVYIVGGTGNVQLTFTGRRGFIDDISVAETTETALEKAEMTEAGFATFVSEFNLAAPDDAKFYIVTDATKEGVKLEEVSSVPAYTPFIIEGEEGIIEMAIVETPARIAENLLRFVREGDVKGADANVYVLANKEKYGVGFYKWAGDMLPLGAVYLEIADATREFIGFGSATGIAEIEGMRNAENEVFNLAGQRVLKAQKGLYIVNGKKVVKK